MEKKQTLINETDKRAEHQRKIDQLNGFLMNVFTAKKEGVPEGTTYKDIAKISSDRYATTKMVSIKVFLFSTERARNNKPYTFIDDCSEDVVKMIRDDLFDVRTYEDTEVVKFAYGQTISKQQIVEDEPKNEPTNDIKKQLISLGYKV